MATVYGWAGAAWPEHGYAVTDGGQLGGLDLPVLPVWRLDPHPCWEVDLVEVQGGRGSYTFVYRWRWTGGPRTWPAPVLTRRATPA